jgi:hypothetical protein
VSVFDQQPRLRPARVLIGWMSPHEAALTLAGRQEEDADRPEYLQRVAQARMVAGGRLPSIETRGVVTEPPPSFRGFLEAFAANAATAPALEEGFRIAIVDLRRLCAAQPMVFTDTELPDEIAPDDLEALADVTLRPPAAIEVPADYNKERHAWILTPPNPNFRLFEEYQTSVGPGTIALGFSLRHFGSFLQAVRYRDRYILRDGYHRAVALLERGISVVPALVKEFDSIDRHFRKNMLPSEAYLGRHAPLLPDYLDDDVSAGVDLPSMRRLIMIQAQEISLD